MAVLLDSTPRADGASLLVSLLQIVKACRSNRRLLPQWLTSLYCFVFPVVNKAAVMLRPTLVRAAAGGCTWQQQ
jgi:hypothetical protein